MKKPIPRIIQANVIAARHARGWHCLGLAREVSSQPSRGEYFGSKQVIYRGESGEIHVLDAFCPHMGADLSLGVVEGDSLRCAFHRWRWDQDGVCDHIPYAHSIPQQARIKSWVTCVQNQLLFVWYDPEGNGPLAEEAIPRVDDCFSAEWTDWQIETIAIDTNCRELVDNMADVAHFGPVHGAQALKFQNIVAGITYTQELWSKSPRLAGDGELFSRAVYWGPAYMMTYMTGELGGVDIESRLLVAHVPTSTESFDLRFGVIVKKNTHLSDAENDAMAAEYVKQNHIAFFQDVEIWHSKTRVDNPLLCDGDGPVNKLRQWHQQFYMDRADVPAALSECKVYETKIKQD